MTKTALATFDANPVERAFSLRAPFLEALRAYGQAVTADSSSLLSTGFEGQDPEFLEQMLQWSLQAASPPEEPTLPHRLRAFKSMLSDELAEIRWSKRAVSWSTLQVILLHADEQLGAALTACEVHWSREALAYTPATEPAPTQESVLNRLRPLFERAVREKSGVSFLLSNAEAQVLCSEAFDAMKAESGYTAMVTG